MISSFEAKAQNLLGVGGSGRRTYDGWGGLDWVGLFWPVIVVVVVGVR